MVQGLQHNFHDMPGAVEASVAYVACHTWNVLVFMWTTVYYSIAGVLTLKYGLYSVWTYFMTPTTCTAIRVFRYK